MAKGGYIGVSSKAKKIKKIYIGVGGVAKKIKKAYIGVNGVAKLFYAAGGKMLISRRTQSALIFNTSDKTLTAITFSFHTSRLMPCQYANGKWITAYDSPMSQSSFGKTYVVVKDENTLAETSIDLGYGQVMGLAVDSTNIYVFQWQSSNSNTYFKVISQSTLTITSSTLLGGIYIGSQTYPANPCNICSILSNGTIIVAQMASSAQKIYAYNKSTSTLTEIYSAYNSLVHPRALSGLRAGFRSNYVLGTTNGVTETHGATTEATYYGVGDAMAYGNGRWVALYNRYSAVSTNDGTNWTLYDLQESSTRFPRLYAVTFADGLFYAVGRDTYSSDAPWIYSSTDGITWTEVTTLTSWSATDMPISDLCFSTLHGVGNS